MLFRFVLEGVRKTLILSSEEFTEEDVLKQQLPEKGENFSVSDVTGVCCNLNNFARMPTLP